MNEYFGAPMPKLAAFLFLLFSPLALFADVPDIGDNQYYTCLEQQDELGCFGDIYKIKRNGVFKRLNLNRATRQANRRIRKSRRKLRRAERRFNLDRVSILEERIEALLAASDDFEACWNYDDPDCGSSGGGGGSGGGGNGGVSAACNVVESSDADERVQGRIVNGAVCTRGDSPVVPISVGGSNICTGTLIAPNIVLTAAHCIDDNVRDCAFDETDCSRFTVESGTGDSKRVSSCVGHPSYDPCSNVQERNDVALLFLSGDLDARTANIYTTNDFSIGESVVTAGYGRNEEDDENLRATFNQLSEVTNVGLATEYTDGNSNEGTTCNGDSGGPLFIERNGSWQLIGVVSWGTANDCALPGTSPSTDEAHWANITSSAVLNFIAEETSGIVP